MSTVSPPAAAPLAGETEETIGEVIVSLGHSKVRTSPVCGGGTGKLLDVTVGCELFPGS
jgi:hypothetical protein